MGWKEIGPETDGDMEEYDDFGSMRFEKPGDSFSGIVKGMTKSDYDDDVYGYIVEESENKARIVWAGPVILAQKMQDVDIGDEVKVTYEGEIEHDKYPNNIKDFSVEVWEDE